MTNLIPFFEWLLAASFRASAVTLVVLAVQFVLRRHLSSRARYALWLPVLFVLLTPVFPESRWSVENAFIAKPEPVQVLPLNTEVPSSTALPVIVSDLPQPAPPTPIDWSSVRLSTWLFVASATLLFMGLSFAQTLRRFKKSRQPVSHELHSQIAQIAREVGLRHAPRVWTSAAIQSPAVTGLLRPVLLLPADFDREFTPQEASLILQHELTHLKRHDLPLHALMCLLMVLHWFNPLLWLAFFCIRTDREAACDAQVLQNATPRLRSDYGHALLKVETAFAPLRLSLGFVGLFQRGAALRSRIQSIATQHRSHPAMKLITTVCIVLMTFLGITSAAIDAEKAPAITIKARFIEISGEPNQPTGADEVLAQTLADMPLSDKNGGPLKAVLDDAQNQTFVRRISQQKRVDLMSTPSVITRSGQKASIEVVREFTLPPGKGPLLKKVGVMMDVLPTLNDENGLDLTVNPRVVEFEGFLKDKQGQEQPVFNERKADAHLRLKSGQTAVLDLGTKTDTQDVEDITDGKTVRHTDRFTRRVIVLVTAQVVDAAPKVVPSAGFTIGQSLFRPGDDIRITQVQRGADFMTVTADYELTSAEEANISLHITSTKNTSGTKTAASQSKAITKGKGTVVLHHPSIDDGMPHVSFYPTSGGKAFGGIYFGTVEEADRSRKMKMNFSDSTSHSLHYPDAPVKDIIPIYEKLTGKKIRVDDTVGAQESRIRIISNQPLSSSEAIAFIESSLLLSGYQLHANGPDKLILRRVGSPPSPMEAKLKSIVFPSALFQDATLEEVIEYIRIKSRDLDTATTDPDKKGVNIILKASAQNKTARITLDLKDVPMSQLLLYVTELSQTKFQVAPFAILVTSIDEPEVKPAAAAPPAAAKNEIIFPSVEFRDATLAEAVEFIRIKSRDLDPAKKGVNILVKPGGSTEAKLTLSLKNVPVSEALRYIAELAGHKLTTEGNTFIIAPVK